MFNYKPYINALINSMSDNGCKIKPFPKVVLDTTKQDDDVFIQTGYYDPETKTIRVFVANRHPKDVLRSIAHEVIHHKQNLEGRLSDGAYDGQRIVDDGKLMSLEREAYELGNSLFRTFTETTKLNKNNK